MTNVIMYAADKPREIMLARALEQGVREHGDTFEIRRKAEYGENPDGTDRRYVGPTRDTDVAVVFGVKGDQIFWDHKALGIPVIYIDKGWSRDTKGGEGHTLYSRCAINASSPIHYMMDMKVPHDRLERLRIEFKPRRSGEGGHIIYASSSQKYHEFHRLGDATRLAEKTVRRIRGLTDRQVVYRPKPGDKSAKPIMGAMLSTRAQSMTEALKGCHAVVTFGASVCMDAIVNGVPAIVLGDGIAAPVAQRTMDTREDLEHPFFPNDVERMRWAAAMAYCQWTRKELASGEAWTYLRDQIRGLQHGSRQ
jgi:hypothetical protein